MRFIQLMCLCFVLTAQAEGSFKNKLNWQSPIEQVALVELFTSEGCYSCPPAEQWVNMLKDHSGLFTQFVPMAFHVDYWDHLGWTDALARPAYSQRQRNYQQRQQLSQVYTPGMMKNGQEWRDWRKPQKAFNQLQQRQMVGRLSLTTDNQVALVKFEPAVKSSLAVRMPELNVHAAVLQMNLKNTIRDGENKGKVLQHDFVVRQQKDWNLASTDWQWQLPFNELQQLISSVPGSQRVLVIWLTEQVNTGTTTQQLPIQVVAGYL